MKRGRVVDFAIYSLLGLAVGGLAVASALLEINSKWFVAVFETLLVFGSAMGYQRRRWKNLRLWITLFAMFVLHVVLTLLCINPLSNLRAWWVGEAIVLETALIQMIVEASFTVRWLRKRGMKTKH